MLNSLVSVNHWLRVKVAQVTHLQAPSNGQPFLSRKSWSHIHMYINVDSENSLVGFGAPGKKDRGSFLARKLTRREACELDGSKGPEAPRTH